MLFIPIYQNYRADDFNRTLQGVAGVLEVQCSTNHTESLGTDFLSIDDFDF